MLCTVKQHQKEHYRCYVQYLLMVKSCIYFVLFADVINGHLLLLAGFSMPIVSAVPPSFQCMPGQFRCATGQCIDAGFRCDHQIDCLDRSDETGCRKFVMIFFLIDMKFYSKDLIHFFALSKVLCNDYIITEISNTAS